MISYPSSRSGRRCVVAVVLGTALSACGVAAPASAAEVTTAAITDIGRYCTACWRNARLPMDRWGDCTQEVYCRLLEKVPRERWGLLLREESEERREFLRAIDAVKKRTQRDQKRHGPPLPVVTDGSVAREHQRAEDWEALRQTAPQLVSERQQQILQKSSEGWSVQELAREMQLPPERISDEKYKAIRKLRQRWAG